MQFNGRISTLLTVLLLVASYACRAQDYPGVQLADVKRTPIIDEVRLNGTVNALRSSNLSTAVAGLVETVHVDAGDRVEQGEELIHLDDELERHALESAQAETRAAQERLQDAERRLREAHSVGAGRNIAETEVLSRESEVATTRAEVARLVAQQARQTALVARHSLKAPFAGVISARNSDLGEWVTPGDALLMLVDTDHLRLDFQVPQDYFALLDEQTELLVGRRTTAEKADLQTAEDEPYAQRVNTTIDKAIPVSDPQVRTFLLRAHVPDQITLLPGMAVTALLRVNTGEEGLTVPRDAINRYPQGRTTVWIAEPAGDEVFDVREQRVDIGIGFADRVVVRGGLTGDERVVSRGNEALSGGMKVTLSEREAD